MKVAFLYYEHIMVQQFCTLTQKSLNFKGFSCFWGKKYIPFTIAPFLRAFVLEPVTFSCHALRDKIPRKVGRHLVQIMV